MTIDIQRTVSLDAPIVPEVLRGALYQTEQMAHRFVITAKRDGATVDLTGATVSGLVILADGQTKELLPAADMAGVESGKAWVTFGASCYTVPGRFGLTVFATQDGAKTCVYACVGTIQRTQEGTPTVPEDTIPDAATLADMIEQCETAISENLYPVSYDTANPQTLTDTQKTQARANINAAGRFSETTDSRIYFAVGTNWYVSSGQLKRNTNSNRVSAHPFTPPTRYLRIVPASGTTPYVHACANGVWTNVATISGDTVLDTDGYDMLAIQIMTTAAATDADIPAVYAEVVGNLETDCVEDVLAIGAADYLAGYYWTGRVLTAGDDVIGLIRGIWVKAGDEVEYSNPTWEIAMGVYPLNGYALNSQTGWESASAATRRYVCQTDGLLIMQQRGDGITAGTCDATVRVFRSLSAKISDIAARALLSAGSAKTVAFLGDSLTAGVGTNRIFHMYLKDRFGWTCKNYGYGGSGYGRSFTGTGGKMATGQEGMGDTITSSNRFTPNDFLTRIATIPTTVDALVIFGGTNDWAHGDEVSEAEFTAAVENVLTYAQTHFGQAAILVITPVHRQGDTTPDSTTGKTLADYAAIIRQKCVDHGIPCVDLFAESGLYPDNAANMTQYFTRDDTGVADGIHPNHVAHRRMANLMAAKLSDLMY